MRSLVFTLVPLVLVASAAAAPVRSGGYRVEAGAGAVRVVTRDAAGGAFGALCAPGRCTLVHYPAQAGFANGDTVSVRIQVDGRAAQTLDGVAFEGRSRATGEPGRPGVAFHASETLASALTSGRGVRLTVVRDGVTLPGARFSLVGFTEAIAGLAAQPAPARTVTRPRVRAPRYD